MEYCFIFEFSTFYMSMNRNTSQPNRHESQLVADGSFDHQQTVRPKRWIWSLPNAALSSDQRWTFKSGSFLNQRRSYDLSAFIVVLCFRSVWITYLVLSLLSFIWPLHLRRRLIHELLITLCEPFTFLRQAQILIWTPADEIIPCE